MKIKKKYMYTDIKIPWIEKYRPMDLNDILLSSYIKTKFNKMLEENNLPNLIITGEPGTGKTSTVLCLSKKLYSSEEYENSVLELNASDDRGLSVISNIILPFCKKKMSNVRHKLIILDEADSITTKAQNLLSNILTEPNKTKFIFICNDCTKINESIQSKCMIIKFPKISYKNIFKKIKFICEKENLKYTDKGIESLLFVSMNDIRKSINNLECIYYSYGELSENSVYDFVDIPKPVYISNILKSILNKKLEDSINTIKELYDKGYSPNDILLTFMKFLLEDKFNIDEELKLKIYEIVSVSYIRVNDGIQTLLQLCGCISKIHILLDE